MKYQKSRGAGDNVVPAKKSFQGNRFHMRSQFFCIRMIWAAALLALLSVQGWCSDRPNYYASPEDEYYVGVGGTGTGAGGNTATVAANDDGYDYIYGSYYYDANADATTSISTAANNLAINSDVYADSYAYGSYNHTYGSGTMTSAGNIVTNNGEVGLCLIGSYNYTLGTGALISGNNIVTNTGTVYTIYGSKNDAAKAADVTSGENTVVNDGMVRDDLMGSINYTIGGDVTIGSNTVTNNGSVQQNMFGNLTYSYGNGTITSSGNTVINKGSVTTNTLGRNNVYGSVNYGRGDITDGVNTVTNYGTIEASLIGSVDGSKGTGNVSSGGNIVTNAAGAEVGGNIIGSQVRGVSGTLSTGGNQVTNNGTAGLALGSYIQAYGDGTATDSGNTVINNGILKSADILDAALDSTDYDTQGDYSGTSFSGTGTISDFAMALGGSLAVLGNDSWVYDAVTDDSISLGSNTITNSGEAQGNVIGHAIQAAKLDSTLGSSLTISAAGNTITNNGSVTGNIIGIYFDDATESGTVAYITCNSSGNTIINNGSVSGSILSVKANETNVTFTVEGGDDTVVNNGSVSGDIDTASGNDSVTIGSKGTVGGDINLGDGNDSITLELSDLTFLGGTVYGGAGTDTLYIGGGTWKQSDVDLSGSIFDSIEDYEIKASGDLVLSGDWDLTGKEIAVSSGSSLTITAATTAAGLVSEENGATEIQDTASLTLSDTADVSGSLLLDGTLTTSQLILESSGVLSGTGVVNGSLVNYGTISPGHSPGTLTVSSYTQAAGSYYDVEIGTASNDLIHVTGAATIEGGIVRLVSNDVIISLGDSYEILIADGGVTGEYDAAYSTLPTAMESSLLRLTAVTGSNNVALNAVLISFAELAQTPNTRAVGAALDTIMDNEWETDSKMEQALCDIAEYSDAKIRQGMQDINPEMYSAFVDMALFNTMDFSSQMHQHLSLMRSALVPDTQALNGQNVHGWNLWGNIQVTNSDNSGSDFGSGYDHTDYALYLGGDHQFTPWLTAGVALGHTYSDMDYDIGNGSGDQQSTSLGLYAEARRANMYVQASVSGSYNDNDVQRYQSLFNEKVEADYSGMSMGVSVEAGMDRVWNSILFNPFIRVGWLYADMGDFNEDTDSVWALHIESSDQNTPYSLLGARMSGDYQIKNMRLRPSCMIGWQHMDDDSTDIDARFMGYSSVGFTVTGADLPGDCLVGNAAVDLFITEKISINAKLSGSFGEDYNSFGGDLGFVWRF